MTDTLLWPETRALKTIGYTDLPVPFGTIVGLAEHLAVSDACGTSLAPSRYVVGIHLIRFPNFGFVSIVTESAQWAIRLSFGLCSSSLPRIDRGLIVLAKDSDIKQLGILFSA